MSRQKTPPTTASTPDDRIRVTAHAPEDAEYARALEIALNDPRVVEMVDKDKGLERFGLQASYRGRRLGGQG